MPQLKLTAKVMGDPKEEKLRQVLGKIKSGYYMTKRELAQEIGCKDRVAEKWLRRYDWMKRYRCYMRLNGENVRTAVYVNPKFKAQLIRQNIATENY